MMKGTALGDALAKAMRSASSLQNVDLGHLKLDDDFARRLVEALCEAPKLTSLCILNVAGLSAFLDSMPCLPRLKTFKFFGGSMAEAQAVLRSLEANPPREVRDFYFQGSPGWPGKGAAIFRLLEQMPDLQKAFLRFNELGTEDLMPVLKNVTFSPNLQQIFISFNKLTANTKRLLRKACKRCEVSDR